MARSFIDTETTKQMDMDTLTNSEDNVVSQRFKRINQQATNALFDNTHTTEKLNKVYEEMDKKQAMSQKDVYDDFNPFYGNKNALNTLRKHSYKEVVSTEDVEPVLEVREEIQQNTKTGTMTQRKKLWMITGCVCIALFIALFTYNMISINSISNKVSSTQYQIAQQEKALEEGWKSYRDRLSDLDIAEAGLVEANLSSATSVDLSPKITEPQYKEQTNFWDKVCNFFAKIFGR